MHVPRLNWAQGKIEHGITPGYLVILRKFSIPSETKITAIIIIITAKRMTAQVLSKAYWVGPFRKLVTTN